MRYRKQLTLEQEASVLFYLENHRGKQMKGETRELMYEIYSYFSSDGRTSSVCTCLDRDTFKKVDGFINTIEWSEETKSSAKMKQVLPSKYVEPIIEEEESTQPVDMNEVLESMKIRTTIPQEDVVKAKSVPVKPQTRRKRTTKK